MQRRRAAIAGQRSLPGQLSAIETGDQDIRLQSFQAIRNLSSEDSSRTLTFDCDAQYLNRFDDGATIDEAKLLEAKLIRGKYYGVKILGDGDLSKKLTISVDKVSATARENIEKAGGAVTVK